MIIAEGFCVSDAVTHCVACQKELKPDRQNKFFCHEECEAQYIDMKFAAEEAGCFS